MAPTFSQPRGPGHRGPGTSEVSPGDRSTGPLPQNQQQRLQSLLTLLQGVQAVGAVGIAGILANVQSESRFNPNLKHPDQPRFSGEAHFAHGLYQESAGTKCNPLCS